MIIKKFLTILSCTLISLTAVSCSNNNEKSAEHAAPSQPPANTTSEISVTVDISQDTSSCTTSSESTSDSDIFVELKLNSNWDSGGKTTFDYTFTVKNESDSQVNGWKVTIPTDGGSVGSAWSTKYSENSGIITALPETYNAVIEPHQSAEFGMQIVGGSPLDTSKIALKTEKGKSSAASNSEKSADTSKSDIPQSRPAENVPEPSTDDWLSAKGSKIIDKSGCEVWLTGCNWFGYNTGTNCFDGLWACDLDTSLAAIADHGFNLLRIPISTELVNNWEDGVFPPANYNNATNSYLNGLNSLEIFDHTIGQCRANGIKIMIDFHCAVTDSMGHMKPLWVDGSITEKDYFRALEWIADRYKNDDTIIAIDLENEPHGKQNESPRAKWDGSKDSDNWKYIAEQAAGKVLGKNPNLLVMVEGIEIYPKNTSSNGNFSSQNEADYYFNWWGGNLRGVADNPVDLGKFQNKLVYSPHDYGPSVYEQPWFKGGYDYDSLRSDCWYDNWSFIQDKNIAPLLIGEWGGFMTEPNLTWMTCLRQFIKDNRINHTFWCFNSNSGDTGGLVLDDFTTWDNDKYNFVKEVLWQKNGKFVGLDHKIPLGKNGISLSDAS